MYTFDPICTHLCKLGKIPNKTCTPNSLYLKAQKKKEKKKIKSSCAESGARGITHPSLEAESVVKQVLGGRFPEMDEIHLEFLEDLDVVGLSSLTFLCNIAWTSGALPLNWDTHCWWFPFLRKGARGCPPTTRESKFLVSQWATDRNIFSNLLSYYRRHSNICRDQPSQ